MRKSHIVMFLLIVFFIAVLSALDLYGQGGVGDHSELLDAQSVRARFQTGEWIMKRGEFEKKDGVASCRTEFYMARETILWQDDAFCGYASRRFIRENNASLVVIMVFAADRFRKIDSDSLVKVSEYDTVLIGSRTKEQYISRNPFRDERMNAIVSEIYSSINIGEVEVLFGRRLAGQER